MSEKAVKKLESDIATITFSGGHDSSSDDDSARTQSSERDDLSPGATDRLAHTERFNPFNKETEQEVAVFPQLHNGSSLGTSRSRDDPDNHVINLIDANIDISEDHFSLPEGVVPEASIAELEKTIAKYKQLVTQCTEKSEKQRELVNKLIQLRMQLAQAKEAPEAVEDESKHVVGHRFVKKDTVRAKHYCEQCAAMIWGVVSEWHRCSGCGFCCHTKCLNSITRTCASVKVENNPQFLLSICPEKGLSSQNYRCAECRTPISYQSGYGEPRRCDYTGSYYCSVCHWNDALVIPARVLHDWDFQLRKVCRASKQFLKLMVARSVLRVQDINPMLFVYVEELNQVKKLREEILIMKKYFLSCPAALKSKLLLQLKSRQHFVENSDMYSLRDLMDVCSDALLPQLITIHASFAQHIKTDCKACQGKGHACTLCDDLEALFPFDNHATVCAKCSTVLHRHCYFRRNQQCPNCDKMAAESDKMAAESESTPATNGRPDSSSATKPSTGSNNPFPEQSKTVHTSSNPFDEHLSGDEKRVHESSTLYSKSSNPFDEPPNPFDEPPNPFDEPLNPFDET